MIGNGIYVCEQNCRHFTHRKISVLTKPIGTVSTNKTTVRTRRWREANRAEYNQYMKNHRSTKIEQMIGDDDEIWFEKEPRKRAALKRATPPWADHAEIRQVYKKCVELNLKYPDLNFVVHHIIPVSHPSVCGLHIASNLEIVSGSRKKQLGRRFNSSRIG